MYRVLAAEEVEGCPGHDRGILEWGHSQRSMGKPAETLGGGVGREGMCSFSAICYSYLLLSLSSSSPLSRRPLLRNLGAVGEKWVPLAVAVQSGGSFTQHLLSLSSVREETQCIAV